MSATISVNNLERSYGKKTVLSEVNLTIEEGQIYGFIGPSASGKTTLVKLIAGIDSVDFGTVDVLGKRVPNLELLSNIGYMAQSDAFYNELTGKENLAFFAGNSW